VKNVAMSNSILEWLLFCAKVGAGGVVVVLGLLYQFQNKLLYHPNPQPEYRTVDMLPFGYNHPGQYNARGEVTQKDPRIEFLETMVKTKDGESIHTWLMLQKNSENLPTIIYFHGNACNMGLRLPKAAQMFARTGANILMMDYRGYGSSTGTPTEEGLNLDAQAVLDYAASHPRLCKDKIALFGDSLGGAVVFSLAHKSPNQVHYLIVENTFTSISDMVERVLPIFKPVSFLKSLVLRIGWDSLKAARDITQPILFISGDSDELVPPSHMRALHDAATKSASRDFFVVKKGQHNNSFETVGAARFCARIRKLLFGEAAAADSAADRLAADAPTLTTAEILPDVY